VDEPVQLLLDLRGGLEVLVGVEAHVAVAPVDAPQPGLGGVAQPGDGGAVLLADPVPRRPDLDDVDMPLTHVSLDAQLVPLLLGDALARPQLDPVQVALRDGHGFTLSSSGASVTDPRPPT